MAFTTSKGSQLAPDSPEALFRDLRGRSVQGLLSQQADMLRAYAASGGDKADVALQLPTGSGKTLVGLLIAEWRRRRLGERAIFLCPTRQLVNQVVENATRKYGIRVHGLAGPWKEFDPAHSAEYRTAEAVAVTTYSAVFNTNPFFGDPQTIVLDDAHAAENYISTMWSLRVPRTTQEALFRNFVTALRPAFSETDFQRVLSENPNHWDESWIETVPSTKILPIAPALEALLDEHCQDGELNFKWTCLKGHLLACNIFLSTREILVRPLIPPTSTHAPFAGARHRVYMSATLGAGGDLERTTGRRAIHRISPPAGYEKQGVGRRLFIFPGRSLDEAKSREMVSAAISQTGRALYLVPSDAKAEKVRGWLRPREGATFFDAQDLEQSKGPFVATPRAIALVANRYDGIDLLGDECRMLVIDGFPRTTNLQEQFLVTRMAAGVLLDERIGTRLAQGFGRCTRSDTDFAAVVILGDDLSGHLMRREHRAHFHPELQAEIEFGLTQSRDLTVEDFIENVRIFLEQGKEWQAVEPQVLSIRDHLERVPRPGEADLARSVGAEVAYADALWAGDLVGALAAAEAVLAALLSAPLRGYRALWNYLAGSCAWRLADQGQAGLEDRAKDYFRRAAAAAIGVQWLHEVAREIAGEEAEAEPHRQALQGLVCGIEAQLDHLGLAHDRNFEREVADVMKGLWGTGSPAFERAHVALGRLLGYQVGGEETEGAPDAWWQADESLVVVFEDNVDGNPSSSLSTTKVRQAASHEKWIRERLGLSAEALVIPALVTSRKTIDGIALPHGRELRYWHLDDFRAWTQRAIDVLRQARPLYSGRPELSWRGDTAGRLRTAGVDVGSLLTLLGRVRVSDLVTR